MDVVELDSQGIERRDFPIVRRGYDPASVDAHLRALAANVEELRRQASSRGQESLASSAGTQVQGILEAAQATAETIEREAAQDAQRARASATADAKRTREEAVARAQEHVAAVSKATQALLERVGSLDGETQALVDSLRHGAGRLADDLGTVEREMGALYDAASGRAGNGEEEEADASRNGAAGAYAPVAALAAERSIEPQAEPGIEMPPESSASSPQATTSAQPGSPHEVSRTSPPPSVASSDLDGARLVALNMALNGDSRDDTARYLAENFDIPDRERLLDEVYAAIEG
jgi:DivIVA domain-containing protein